MARLISALAIGAFALLAGCATISPEERAAACAQTDWHRYGANDGQLGVAITQRGKLFEECTRVGQPADIMAYEAGHAEGVREYCTVENGFEVGRQGRPYHDVCPPELEPDFRQGLAEGRRERPNVGIYPGLGVGIGPGRVRGGVGLGLGVGGWGYPFYDGCYYRDPFPCSWRRGGPFGYPYWW